MNIENIENTLLSLIHIKIPELYNKASKCITLNGYTQTPEKLLLVYTYMNLISKHNFNLWIDVDRTLKCNSLVIWSTDKNKYVKIHYLSVLRHLMKDLSCESVIENIKQII